MIRSFTKGVAFLAIAWCCTLFSLQAAQAANTVTYDGTDTHCGDLCCQKFTITVDKATDRVHIYLTPFTGASDCFDNLCWTGQSTGTRTFKKGANYWDFEIDIAHTDPAWTGPFPVSFDVWICGSQDCLNKFLTYYWSTDGSFHESGNEKPLYEGNCTVLPPCSSGCSRISVAAGPGPVPCGTEVCFWNQSGGVVTSFTLNFNPPINTILPCPASTGGPVCSSPNDAMHMVGFHTNWTFIGDQYGNVTFTSGGGITSCSDPVCVFIPYCSSGYKSETVTLVDPVNPKSCASDYTSVNVAMKPTTGLSGPTSSSADQNYPNPLEASNGFKTTIPFTTSAQGLASIRVIDPTGKEVLTTDEEVTYAGKHFFYLTADRLPAGTYFYTIEFPKGVVIAQKTMLVVK